MVRTGFFTQTNHSLPLLWYIAALKAKGDEDPDPSSGFVLMSG